MKILYVTTISNTIEFFPEHIKMLQSQGHTVDIACHMQKPLSDRISMLRCKVHEIPFSRNPLSINNFKAYKKLEKLIKDEKYDLIHTHTPNASVCARLAARKLRKKGLIVIYTAHGFHFYKGAPLKNWLLYYPVEKLCSYWTDVLITINKEDYMLAQKKMKAKKVYYVPGVGIDTEKFKSTVVDKRVKRAEFGIPVNSFLLLSVGELNSNKNHEMVIKVIARLNRKDIHYAIVGKGDLNRYLEQLAVDLGVAGQVHLLGFRTDVGELYKMADVYIHPSFREGLPVSVVEAMASGLPCAVSKIRGNTDLIDENGGVLFDPTSISECERAIKQLLGVNRYAMGNYNQKNVKNFDFSAIIMQLKNTYSG